MGNEKKESDGFDEEELIRSEFESIISGLNLDQSSPSTYLDDLDRIDDEAFTHQIQLHKLPEAFFNLRGMQFNAGFTKLIAMMMEPPYE